MKRNYIPFIAGMSTMLLLVGLVGASLAGETRPPAVPQSGTLNGQVAYGEAGVALFGKEQVPAGAAWTTEDGAQIPTVLTYTDENGEDHYFISAETAAEVLDMVYGAVYREDLNCIDFGTEAAVDAEGNPRLDGNGQPIYWTGAEFFSRRTTQNEDGTERIIAIGNQKAEIQVGDGTSVIVGHGLEEDSPIREELIQRQMETPTVPEYGVSCGVFTEVDPAVLDPAAYLGRFVDGVALQGADLTYTFHFMPELPYAALVIENQGDQDILVRVFRPWTVGHINQELFSMVRIPAGETLVRAFQVQEGESADLRNKLTVDGKVGANTWNAIYAKYTAAHGLHVPYPGIVLRQGSEGGTVRLVQQKLRGEGETLTADGKYGAKTTEAVRRYQKRNSLTADGSVGSATWEKMF